MSDSNDSNSFPFPNTRKNPPRDAKRNEKKNINGKLKEKEEENMRLGRLLKEANEKKTETEEKNTRLERALEEANGKKTETEEKNARLERALEKANGKKTETEEKNARLERALEEANGKKTETEEKNARLERALEEANGKKTETEEKNARLERALEKANEKKTETEEKNARLERALEETTEKKTETEEKNARLERALEEANRKKTETEEKNARLERALEEANGKKTETEEKNARLERALEEANGKKTETEEKNTRLERALEEANGKKTETEEKNARLERALEEANGKKTETEEKNARLESALEKNRCYLIGLTSVLIVVLLYIGLHLAFKGHEMNHHELRLMLVGKTGAGKSASGNTILGEEAFRVEASPASVTASCMKKNKVLDGRNITIIDSPGVMDTWLISNQTAHNAHECISMSSPVPHVFLLVIRLGRFTVEESNAVKWIQENFGEEALKFTMILFTGGDLLEGKTVEKFISNSYDLQNLVDTCEGRYHVFNNYELSNRTQVTELFEKIDVLLHKNMGYFYTKELHQKVQRSTREEEERKRVILEKEFKTLEEMKRALMEKLIREEEKIKSEQRANEVKEEAQRECNSREREIRQGEELKRNQQKEAMEVQERRKINEMAIKLRDEQYENQNLKAELQHAYRTSFWFKVSTGVLIVMLIGLISTNNQAKA